MSDFLIFYGLFLEIFICKLNCDVVLEVKFSY